MNIWTTLRKAVSLGTNCRRGDCLAFRSTTILLSAILTIVCCQKKQIELTQLDKVDGEINAQVNALYNTGVKFTLNWQTEVSPTRWVVNRTENGATLVRNAIAGNQRAWKDDRVLLGRSYTYEIIAEVDDLSTGENKVVQIPFKRITIDSPSASKIDEIGERSTCTGEMTQEPNAAQVRFNWNSAKGTNAAYWTLERSINKTKDSLKELYRTSQVEGTYEYIDNDIASDQTYIYDFVIISTSKSPEGHSIETRIATIHLFLVDVRNRNVMEW